MILFKILLYVLLVLEVVAVFVITGAALSIGKGLAKRWQYRRLFWVIQFVSWQLEMTGWIICFAPPVAKHLWIYWNDDNPPNSLSWWKNYLWLAWRNPVDNFKHVEWTQAPMGKDGPLTYKSWLMRGKPYYYKAGWMSDTYCALSAGAGRGGG